MDCCHKKDQNVDGSLQKKEANSLEIDYNLVVVVTKVNMLSDVKGWWIDTGATRHICLDKNMFSEYNKIH